MPAICKACSGCGEETGDDGRVWRCIHCDGSGVGLDRSWLPREEDDDERLESENASVVSTGCLLLLAFFVVVISLTGCASLRTLTGN